MNFVNAKMRFNVHLPKEKQEFLENQYVVKSFLRYPKFGMIGNDLIRRLPLSEQWADYIGHFPGLLNGQIHTLTGINKRCSVIILGLFGIVFVESAADHVFASIACTRGPVPSRAAEGYIKRSFL